ncbi:MAG: T9SS type A sorting domain-containing protein [Bacteroidales bacterium]|nr:T9SS type A sorting domain-containing protein [Bacteroidales bacterium]
MKRKNLNKKRIYISIMLMLFGTLAFSQTKVIIYLNDESQNEIIVGENGKIYFDNTDLFIDSGDGSPANIALNNIRKIVFEDISSSLNRIDIAKPVIIYPNPTNDFIQIGGLSDGIFSLTIYSIDRQTLMSGYYNCNDKINVALLPKGIYAVKINDIILKLIKL